VAARTGSDWEGPEADRNRKSDPKAETLPVTMSAAPVSVSGSAGDFPSTQAEAPAAGAVAVAIEDPPPQASGEVTPDSARDAVLAALEDAGQQMLAHNLESGEWSVGAHEVSVKVAMSQVMVDVALGDGPKRIVQEALLRATGRHLKFKMVSGGAQFAPKPASPAPRPANGVGARSRAMSDPIVQRMQEKFGAEIRSVIDHKERG
jgi:DNA polymerase-3 subunit gamma/tau